MIYHILPKAEWLEAKARGTYEPESVSIEGFIHCSTEQQFDQVANFYFKGHHHLVVIEIDDKKVADRLKWESVGSQKFPHIYGPLDVHEVLREADLIEGEEGLFEFPFKPVVH